MKETNLSVYVPALEWLGIGISYSGTDAIVFRHDHTNIQAVTEHRPEWYNACGREQVIAAVRLKHQKWVRLTCDGFPAMACICEFSDDCKFTFVTQRECHHNPTIAVLEAVKALYEAQVKEAGA